MELHLFFTATVAGGALSGEARHPNDYSYAGEGFTHALRWMSRDEIQRVNVFPRDLKALFWDDLARGFPEVRFLGVEREDL